MKNIKIITLKDRIKRAVKAFKGEKIGELHFGIEVKRCDECEYRKRFDNPELFKE